MALPNVRQYPIELDTSVRGFANVIVAFEHFFIISVQPACGVWQRKWMVFVQYKLCPWGAEVVFGPASFFPGFIYHTYRWASTGNSYACHDHHNLAGIGLMFLAAMWWWFCLIMKAMDRNFSPWNSYKSQIKYWCETDEIIRINAFIANKFIFSPVICFGLVSLGGWPSMTHRFAFVDPLSRWQIEHCSIFTIFFKFMEKHIVEYFITSLLHKDIAESL